MSHSWFQRVFRPADRYSSIPRRGRATPQVLQLEERDVPAVLFVDPDATPGNPVWNEDRPNSFTGTFGVNVFNDLVSALAVANANGEPDTINLSYDDDIFAVNSPANTTIFITESVNIVGSGAGVSIIQPVAAQSGAVFAVTGAGTVVNFSNVSFYGSGQGFDANGLVIGGDQTAVMIRYEAGTTGTISQAVFQGIYADFFSGFALDVSGAGTSVTVQDSTFSSIGRVGVAAYDGASVSLFGNTYTGKGAGLFLDTFAQITGGATAVISGNTVTGGLGVGPGGESSSAIIVSQGGGPSATAQIFGNQFSGNVVGIAVGDNPADTSTATINYNNIFGNLTGVATDRSGAAPAINAANNWWGSPTGPFNATSNPTGLGNTISNDVAFTPDRAATVPVVAAPDLPAYLAEAFPINVWVETVQNAAEPATNGLIRFTRTGDLTQPLTITYTVNGTATPGVDYVALPGTVTFAANQATADVPVNVIDDTTVEGTETVVVTINPTAGHTVIGGSAVVLITDDDVASAQVSVEGTANAAEPATNGNFRFTRTGGDLTQPLTVTYAVGGTATPGVDYTALSGTVTFAANQTTVDVPVNVIDNTTVDGTRTVTATITAGTGYAPIGGQGVVLIFDNDVAPAQVSVEGTANAAEPATNGNFRFTRTGGDLTQPLTVTYTVGGTATPGVDYTALSGTVTFAANQTTVDVPVNVIDNATVDGTRTVTATITAGTGYAPIGGQGVVLIFDNDTPPVVPVVSVAATQNAVQGQTNGNFRFTRTGGDLTQPLTVTYTVGGTATPGVQYTALSGTATFAANQTFVDVPVITVGHTGTGTTPTTVVVTITASPDYNVAGGSATVTINPASPPTTPSPILVGYREFGVGNGVGTPTANLYNPDGTLRSSATVFATAFTGGVRTAAADFNGDGVADLVVGTGPGAPTLVRVLDGVTGAELFRVNPFESAFTGGVYVAAGDLTGDGIPDLVITPDEGGGPRVLIYDGNGFTLTGNFFGIADPNFRGGARAAVGDINGDGRADLAVAAGFGGGPRISTYDGRTVTGGQTPVNLFNDIFVFEQTLRNGVFVAVGDVNGDGFADIIAGGGPGGGPRVLTLSGADLIGGNLANPTALTNFFAGNPDNRGGVRVAVKNLDGDNKADLVVGDGTGAGSRVTAYLGDSFSGGTAPEAFAFSAFPGSTGGIYVG